ncbi:helix-turn-helix transcriptional regulator [Marinobacteraceae bacterium S3BR75-40.1]
MLLDLYQQVAARRPDHFQSLALERVNTLLPYDFSAWGGGWASDRRITEVTVVNQDPALFEEWMAVSHLDPYCDLTLRHLNRSFRFEDVDDYRNSLAYNEHWKRFDAHHMLSTIMAEPLDGYVSFIGLCRAPDAPAYTPQQQQLKQLLMPHLSQALHLNRAHFLEGLDHGEEGLALVDGGGVVKASRGRMLAWMRELWLQQRNIPAAVMAELRHTGHWRHPRYCLSASPVGHCWLLRMRAATAADCLTPREAEVASLYALGRTHKEVARELSIAPATVRNQLAQIYRKLGVSDKAALSLCLRHPHG